MPAINTVLFDLDGTLADTAPDLAAALNHVLISEGREALPFETIRPAVSHGGKVLTALGFGEDHPRFEQLYQQLLDYYLNNIATHTTLFPGMAELLAELEARNIRWGIVTNKPGWLTTPLLDALNLSQRATTIVSGDTLPQRKPDPAPLLHACKQAGSKPAHCVYIGDAERDMQAARRAGMHAMLALFGYIADNDQPHKWDADSVLQSAHEILPAIESLSA